jgi:CHAT domain-containing protein
MASSDGSHLYPAVDYATEVPCACGVTTRVELPLLVDWRDRHRMDRLRKVLPTFTCPSCAVSLTVPASIAVIRPGDPVAVVLTATAISPEITDALQEALSIHVADEDGVIPGVLATTSPVILPRVADRYAGFQIMSVRDPVPWPDDDDVQGWLAAVRGQHPWPPLLGDLAAFVTSASEEEAEAEFAARPSLRDRVWDPVVRVVGEQLRGAQPTDKHAAEVTSRLQSLTRLQLMDAAPQVVIREELREMLAVLGRLASSPTRSRTQLVDGIAEGRRLIALAENECGLDHPFTLSAMNDTAALLLDDLADPGESTREARALLEQVRLRAVQQRLPVLADAMTNLALSYLRNDRVADADTIEMVLALLHDALHLYRLRYPDAPEQALSALGNLATLYRSRLAGDPASNIRAALDAFDDTLAIDDGRRFAAVDRLTVEANRLSALADLADIEPTAENVTRLTNAMDAVERQLDPLAVDHPIRTRTLTNLGAIAIRLLALPDDVVDQPVEPLRARAFGWLDDAVENTLGAAADDAARVLAVSTLAALHANRADANDYDIAERLLLDCVRALEDTDATRLHHTVVGNLGRLYLMRGDWSAATKLFANACRYADAVIDRAATPSTRLAHVAAADDLYRQLALCHAQQRDARSVVHTIERSRARWFTAGDVDDDAIDLAVQRLLEEGGALLYIGTCGIGSYAVVLVGGRGAGAWTATASTTSLTPSLRALHTAHTTADVAAALDAAAAVLNQGLLDQAAQILLAEDVRTVGIVAGGALAGLPIAALPNRHGSLLDRSTARYLVTSRSAATAQAAVTSPRRTLAVTNPTGDLPFADSELEALRRLDPATAAPPAGRSIRAWLLDELPRATHLHLACHAIYDTADPFRSRFVLGDNQELTIGDLASVTTPDLRLAVASCCHSGVVDERGADDLVGLAYALIAAGADAAIAALWEIEDIGTSLLVANVYEQMCSGVPPAVAVTNAQRTIRDATVTDLATWARSDSWVPALLRPELEARSLRPDLRPDARPFEHPAHWASLIYIGR